MIFYQKLTGQLPVTLKDGTPYRADFERKFQQALSATQQARVAAALQADPTAGFQLPPQIIVADSAGKPVVLEGSHGGQFQYWNGSLEFAFWSTVFPPKGLAQDLEQKDTDLLNGPKHLLVSNYDVASESTDTSGSIGLFSTHERGRSRFDPVIRDPETDATPNRPGRLFSGLP